MSNSNRSTGTVLWFDDGRGDGFIKNDSGAQVYFHYSEIQMEGYRRTSTGDPVTYVEETTGKGLAAKAVEVYESNWPFEEDFSNRTTKAFPPPIRSF